MSEKWPDLPIVASVDLPPLAGGQDEILWPCLLDLSEHLAQPHAVIGGVMVFLHGAAAGRQPARVTKDVDVLFDVGIVPTSLRDAVAVLAGLDYRVDPASPDDSTHRYLGPNGEVVDILAPAGLRPPPDLTTTPPGRTVAVYGGLSALQNRVVISASYRGRTQEVVVPDLPRAITIKCAAHRVQARDRPAEAYRSRHLVDIAFLLSLVTDIDETIDSLVHESFADITALDDRNHPAWASADPQREDARLVWSELRKQ
ncbi:hypothetical protein ACFQV2_35630 [Actinokineospora soli]|uniref:Nucleotidyl transferase AbiEii toxin, Type IV TA system n=1 Tax=Actinokineospora soli TaxID=1048753 RepID=A0ABW2TVV1_9PSEU